MRCPSCDSKQSRVADTRPSPDGLSIRRRRICGECGFRFTTFEQVEARPLRVVKRRGYAEDFDADKLRKSVSVACARRPVPPDAIDRLIRNVEAALRARGRRTLASSEIGELVMKALEPLDGVAFLRYASVYRDFRSVDDFEKHIRMLEARRDAEGRDRAQTRLPWAQ